jgi:MraZ protein
MFRGINKVSLDAKGRIAIPTKCRETLESGVNDGEVIITIDTEERCLLLYPFSVWEDIEKKIESLPSFNKESRRIQRLLIGHATEMFLDNQGRIVLPQELREYAELKKRAVLVGQGKKIEIWDLNHWSQKRENWLAVSNAKGQNLPEELKILSL